MSTLFNHRTLMNDKKIIERTNVNKIFSHKLFAILLLLSITIISLFYGRYSIDISKIYQDFILLLQNKLISLSIDTNVLLTIRMPRILLALMAGAALASSGMVYQCLFRNPIVSSDILGVSSGACLGAAFAILYAQNSILILQISAFTLGTVAVFISYQLAMISRGNQIMTLVMSGIVVSAFFKALLSILKYSADPYNQLPAIVFWMMGGLDKVIWQDLYFVGPVVITGLIIIFLLRNKLNILSLGDDEAISLGVNVKVMRLILITCSSIIVGSTIAITGIIGWVGLIIPHISRMLVGADHKLALPYSMLIGACFVTVIDTLARTIASREIPIGIISALVGAPFFAYLLLFKQDKGWSKC